jgi:hypothetical protein
MDNTGETFTYHNKETIKEACELKRKDDDLNVEFLCKEYLAFGWEKYEEKDEVILKL